MFELDPWYKLLRLVMYFLLLTPLWVLSMFLFPFITTKILYFRLLVELAFLIYIVLILRYPELRPRFNWVLRAIWIYAGAILATGIFGVDFYRSFWGTIERGEGIVTLLHFAVYFTMLPAVFQKFSDWYKYLFAMLSVTLVSGLYGLAQLLNLPIVIHAGASRINGTIGNASFFAAFMLLGMFLALYLVRFAAKRWQRIYLWLVFGFEAIILYETQTRGAVLAGAAAFFVYLLMSIFKAERKKTRFAAAALLLALIFSGLIVYANRNRSWVKNNGTLHRLTTISASDITTQSRFDTWQASLRGWRDRFWTGYGYENYDIAFNKYFPARIFKDQGSQIWFDRAHNTLLDVAVSGGIFGLAAYLGIFAAAFAVTLRKSKVLTLGLVAFFLQNLFVFDTQATYLLFFGLLAHVAFLKNESAPRQTLPGSSWAPGFVFPAIVSALVFFAAYFVNIQPAFANYHGTQSIKLAKQGLYRQMRDEFKKALSYGNYMDAEIRQRLVDYSSEAASSGQLSREEETEFYQYVIDELKKNIKDSPRDVKNYLYLQNVLNRLGDSERILQEARAAGTRALELSPTRPQIYYELGQTEFTAKNFEAGLEYFRRAIALNPEPKESHINYLLAGIIAGREDIAAQELKILTEDLGYPLGIPEYQAMARAYFSGGNKQKGIEYYRKALELDPENPDMYARIAAAYGDICDIGNARFYVSEAVRLDKSFELEAQVFLQRLETNCKK